MQRRHLSFLLIVIFALASYLPFAQRTARNETAQSVSRVSSSSFDENGALHLGNPSGAEKKRERAENYLIERAQYALSYNNKTHVANWVAWHLDESDLGDEPRSRLFSDDDEIPFPWYRVRYNDFQYSVYGFERGHLCPSADRTSSREDNAATFIMTNIVPQSHKSNSGAWNTLEMYARNLALSGNELYIVAGTYGIGGESEKGAFQFINTQSGENIAVPAFLWKIIIAIPKGDGDIQRITKDALVIAALVPNTERCPSAWRDCTVSIDSIEELTGYDFFTALPDDIEAEIEARVYQN